jgi:hypothetical protein
VFKFSLKCCAAIHYCDRSSKIVDKGCVWNVNSTPYVDIEEKSEKYHGVGLTFGIGSIAHYKLNS